MDILTGVPVLIEQEPEIEFKGGLFYVTDRVGDGAITRVMRPNVFFAAFRKFAEQATEWRIVQSGVVERIDHWRDDATVHGQAAKP